MKNDLKIASIEAIPLHMSFRPEVAPHMLRAVTHGTLLTLYRLRLENGVTGYGDMVGAPGDVSAYSGKDALVEMRQTRHPGIQMACYDAVGHSLGVPAHALMGRQARPQVPFAYWTIDLPPEVLAQQVEYAASLGYTVYKFKCRPWWDPIQQMEAAAKVAPPGFKLWLDFNGHLREARLAVPILQALSKFECVGGFESPIPQRDAEGYKTIRRKIDKPVAAHYGSGCCHVVSDGSFDPGVNAQTQICEGLCDGFVFGSMDVDYIRASDGVAHEARKPFWIQVVGTALRAAWVMHVASTCREALLSSLAAHDLWAEDIAQAPRPVDGWVRVPDGPGLGIEVDEAAIEKLRNAPATPSPRRVSTVVYPSGVRHSFSHEQQRHEAFYFGHHPGFVPGVRLEVREDDNTPEFDKAFAESQKS